MIEGALAGAAVTAWVVLAVAARLRTKAVRRRLASPVGPLAARVGHRSWAGAAAPTRTARARAVVGSRRSASAPRRDLADACDDISRRLRSGHSLATAIIDSSDGEASSTSVVAQVARSARLGEPLPGAIDAVEATAADPDSQLLAQVLGVVAEHGGSPAEAIDRAAATLRERAAFRAERSAQAATARLSTRVMTILPIAFTGLVAATDADVRDVLLRTPIGWVCIALGLALNLAGRAWARHAVRA